MSLCDTCRVPGHCCRRFILNGGDFAWRTTMLEALAAASTVLHGTDDIGYQIGLPFVPFYRDSNGRWWWWCPHLTRDGRCDDYENRPHVCRSFEPASDPLCIYHRPTAENCQGCTPYAEASLLTEKEEVSCRAD